MIIRAEIKTLTEPVKAIILTKENLNRDRVKIGIKNDNSKE